MVSRNEAESTAEMYRIAEPLPILTLNERRHPKIPQPVLFMDSRTYLLKVPAPGTREYRPYRSPLPR